MNKLILEQNVYTLQEDVILSEFPGDLKLIIKGNCYCGIKDFQNKNLDIHLEKDSHLTLEFFVNLENSKSQINIYNEENSKLNLHFSCLYQKENELIIKNTIATSNNNNQIRVHAIENDGTLKVHAIGSIEEHTKNNVYVENIKAITKNNESIEIKPDLLVKTNSVTASHNATISPVLKEELFYLKSKGLTEESAIHLIKDGFLKGILEREEIKEK